MRGMTRRAFVVLSVQTAAGLAACGSIGQPATPTSRNQAALPQPSPAMAGGMSLEEALSRRRSVREFKDTPLTSSELGQLLWAAQGITHERGFRTAPSAGALYPLETYVASAGGVFRYDPQAHQLLVIGHDDARPALHKAGLSQDAIRRAAAVFIVAAVYERTSGKYGTERSPRYVHLEAGHAAQNLLLQAVVLGLGAVPIGAFHDEEVQAALGLPADHEPLYLIPVGHPLDAGR